MDISRAVFGGCSMGGYVAMAVLRAAPSRVSGLVLVNTKASADTPEAKDTRFTMAARVESEGMAWVPDAMRSTLLGPTTLTERPAAADLMRSMVVEQRPAAVAWAQRAMAARPESFDVLSAAQVPALVVRGAEDTLIPADEATAMTEALREAELVELPGVGHLAPLEAPEELGNTLAHWLERL